MESGKASHSHRAFRTIDLRNGTRRPIYASYDQGGPGLSGAKNRLSGFGGVHPAGTPGRMNRGSPSAKVRPTAFISFGLARLSHLPRSMRRTMVSTADITSALLNVQCPGASMKAWR